MTESKKRKTDVGEAEAIHPEINIEDQSVENLEKETKKDAKRRIEEEVEAAIGIDTIAEIEIAQSAGKGINLEKEIEAGAEIEIDPGGGVGIAIPIETAEVEGGMIDDTGEEGVVAVATEEEEEVGEEGLTTRNQTFIKQGVKLIQLRRRSGLRKKSLIRSLRNFCLFISRIFESFNVLKIKSRASKIFIRLDCFFLFYSFGRIQEDYKKRIIEEDDPDFNFEDLKYVAGYDISLSNEPGYKHLAVASMCVMEYPSMDVIYERSVKRAHDIPYCPGFLAFK